MLFHMHEDPTSDQFERLRTKGRTIISKKTLKAIDARFNGGLTAWKKRHAAALAAHPTNETHFNIAVTQLYKTYQKTNDPNAMRFLDKLVHCASNNKCRQVFCPACRTRMQAKKAATALTQFSADAEDNIFMMTLLIKVVQNASDVATVVKRVRNELQNRLRNNEAGLGDHLPSLKMLGAFEVDLVNMGTHLELAHDNRKMMKALGFKRQWRSQHFVHLHAIVGPLDKERKRKLRSIITAALGQERLMPDQLQFDGLHGNKSKEENLERIAHYMYKSRLQFSDYVYENQTMRKKKRYHTPYRGKQLVEFLNAMAASQQFKGLKCEYGL